MKVEIKKLEPDAIFPQYATDGAGCFDLHAYCDKDSVTHLSRHSSLTFRTGLAFAVPEGFVMLIFSRSGHGFNHEVRLANCVGVIDSDYRGEVKVKLTSDSIDCQPFLVRNGDRIAQAMIVPAPFVEFLEVEKLTETARGEKGFGSTGTERKFFGQMKES